MGSRWVPVAGIVFVLVGLLNIGATSVALRGGIERAADRRAGCHGRDGGGLDRRGHARAVSDGIEPDGERLSPPMPTWQLSDAEMEALLAYLKPL